MAVATQAGRQAGGMATRDNEFRICHRLCVNRRGRRKKETATAAAAEKMLRFLFYSFFFFIFLEAAQSLLFGDCHATAQAQGIWVA